MKLNYIKTWCIVSVAVFVVRTVADYALGHDPWRSMGGGSGVAIASAIMTLPIFAVFELTAWWREARSRRVALPRMPKGQRRPEAAKQ